MPLISSCPKCDKPVLIPDGVDASAKAKCPLCAEQFQLQEVFSSLPPMLEIVDAPLRPAHVATTAIADEDDEGFVEFGSGVFGGLDAETTARVDPNSVSTIGDSNVLTIERVDEEAKAPADSGGSFDGIDFGATSEPVEGDSDAESGGMFSPASTAPASLATKARPKRKGPGPLFHIAGVVGFGVLGLLIGYAILLMIKGPQGDIAGIGKYFPSFIYSPPKNGESDGKPNVAVNRPANKSKQKSDEIENGYSKKNGNDDKELPELKFDFDNPNKGNGQSVPEPDPIGPTALKQTLRVDIELALDEVAVKAAELAAIQAMAKDEPDDGSGGTISDLGRAIRDHYFALGHLGLTLASAKKGSLRENEKDELTDRIKQFVHNAASNVDTFDGIGEKASKWIDYEKVEDGEGNVKQKGREGRDGILIAGVVESISRPVDELRFYRAKVKLAGTDKHVTVVGGGDSPTEGERVLLLGAIIADPKKNLASYYGDEAKVVWVSLPIDAPKSDEGAVEPPLEDRAPEPAPDDEVPDETPADDSPEAEAPADDSPDIEVPEIETPEIDELEIEEPELDAPKIDEPTLD